ncbi:hypothetical protein ACFWTE_24325 [Nocardiopsis sp. NPDC058631]|uniref:hypothetical protein n=1 Tax=Nocardiopsis sp. NPDC058631 TaxID=3346566 RepID=UPI0036566AA3
MTTALDNHEPDPEDLHQWTARGFPVADALRWIDAGFRLEAAERWRGSGVYRPGPAKEWRAAGLTPYTVQNALRAGMTPGDAVRWRELGRGPADAADRHLAGERPRPRRLLGFLRPCRGRGGLRSGEGLGLDDGEAETLNALLSAGLPASCARAYLDAGWVGAEGVPWARAGVNAAQARVYLALGFSPSEGAVLASGGHDALALMGEWWGAGVPREEVAAWVAAGYGADEAARARASGTGPEQAQAQATATATATATAQRAPDGGRTGESP